MLAYVADQLSYRQDVIATEAYLGRPGCARRPAGTPGCVDYTIGEGANARAWLRILLSASAPDGIVLRAQTRCATLFPGAKPPFLDHDSLAYQQAVNAGAVFFETDEDSGPLSPRSRKCRFTPGATPGPASRRGPPTPPSSARTRPWPSAWCCAGRVGGPLTGDPADADPRNRQAVRVTNKEVTTDLLNGRAITEIDWDAGDALSFPLCVSSVRRRAGAQQIWGVSAAWGNIVLADQGRNIGTPERPARRRRS